MKARALLIAVALICFSQGAAHAWLTPGSLQGFSGSGGGGATPGAPDNSIQYRIDGSTFGGAQINGLVEGNNAGSPPSAYAGASCSSDQFISALSAAGAATCTNFRVDLAFGINGTPNTSGVYPMALDFTATFPINFAASGNAGTSVAKCSAANGGPFNPSETDVYGVYCDSTLIGTITLSTSCGATFATTGGTSQTCGPGAALALLAPNPVSGSNISFTLSGTR